jgi:sterol desaturase/sphingolipid hydroxylase (fatty acid hydroxylase superfamily)
MLPSHTHTHTHTHTHKACRISDVGILPYLAYFAAYMTSVEFFVYWQHRLLHDIRLGYVWLHYVHHKYNKVGGVRVAALRPQRRGWANRGGGGGGLMALCFGRSC